MLGSPHSVFGTTEEETFPPGWPARSRASTVSSGGRRRRHGHGVPRRGPQARPPGGAQGAAARARRRARRRAVPPRDPGRGAACSIRTSCRCYDSGEADGFLYYVMPYVEGESLRERLARERRAAGARRGAASCARWWTRWPTRTSQGVVHRDIKPDNMMLSGRHALVTDFGVAKAVSEATGRQQLTTAGVALGTPSLHGAGAGRGRPEPRPPGGHLRRGRHGVRAA